MGLQLGGIAYIFLGMGQDLFHVGVETMGGLTQEKKKH